MSDLEFTGERFLPGTPGGIAYEHWHRYAFALRYATGRRVLDAACGEGYGTALLAGVAAVVTGVDIDTNAVNHARAAYRGVANIGFECGSVTALPLADASVDLVVSFETIEHLPAADQPRMLAEFARVLAPDGVLVLSSPNKRRYSDVPKHRNPFHLHELYRSELEQLLDRDFAARRWYDQVPLVASAIFGESGGTAGEAWCSTQSGVTPATPPEGLYYLVVAAKSPTALPAEGPLLSVLTDAQETELARAEHHAAEVLRLDALLLQRDREAQDRAHHVEHLEGLLGRCEGVVQEREGELATCRGRRRLVPTGSSRTCAARSRGWKPRWARRRPVSHRGRASSRRLGRACASSKLRVQRASAISTGCAIACGSSKPR